MEPQQPPGSPPASAPVSVDLGALYQETQAALHTAELHAAELRGQLRLIERLVSQAQRPILSGDPLSDPQP